MKCSRIGLALTLVVWVSSSASGADYAALEKQNAAVKPAVKPYTVRRDLSNVANWKLFKSTLGSKERALIVKNGFCVTPTNYTQMFHAYENNEYMRPKWPAFITADSMLHTYHVFYDYTLRKVESEKLFDLAVKLTDVMLKASEEDLSEAKDADLNDAARRNVAYFAVARKLLADTAVPESVAGLADPDLALIAEHKGRAISSVFGYKMDFSQFVPRGHYTRSERLKKYFRAMMWYGLSPLPIPQGKIGKRPTMQALLIVRNLRERLHARDLWETIYEPTVFYVGTADDYTLHDYGMLMDKVYGKVATIETFADQAKLDQFISEVKKLKGPGIENFVATSRVNPDPDPLLPVGRQFRFMGQRFIPDSRIMQELTHPKARGRNFPSGLDVFAALGSERALTLLQKYYEVKGFDGHAQQMAKMRKEMRETKRATWQSNLYYGWLWSLQSLTKLAPSGYPSFMRNDAWLDKSLWSGLGSWTELRHDTILYAKQSVTECGGAEEEVAQPKGYVEPNLDFWSKLEWLNSYTRDGLSERGLLSEELKDKFETLGDWLSFCRRITIKELTNQYVTEDEYTQIEIYGAELESLTKSFAGGDIWNEEDNDMALVADVHTSFGSCLEEATGRAGAIYVVVPIRGKLYLTRGAVYTHYEFMHPASDRLTDKKWQEMLKSGKAPGFADWVKSFFIKTNKKPAPQFENYPGGC